jgi:hypothetical protein
LRPHVETIHENDYVWHRAELVGGEGRASERRLSVDEEDGSCSLRIDFHTDWRRGSGIHHANTEYYVLEGEMTIGDRTIGKGAYVYAPRGVPTQPMRFKEGSQILHYREYGDAGFDSVDSVDAPRWPGAREDVLVIDTEAMKWDPVPNPGPMPGMYIKYLHIDPETHFYTRLVYAQEGWVDHRLAHHPCYEEAFTLQGKMSYNFGDLIPGTYFFRPARVKHGHFVSMEGGTTWLLRSDGELFNWYTQNEWARWGGEAVNWGPNGGRMQWSMSSHDLAGSHTWRTDKEIEQLNGSVAYQRSQGQSDVDYVQHGTGTDKSLIAMARAMEHARSLGQDPAGHEHGNTDAEHEHSGQLPTHASDYGWVDPKVLEHPDERTDDLSYNWGAGRPWRQGQPIPAPILSSLPVRSRSTGRWDGDGL